MSEHWLDDEEALWAAEDDTPAAAVGESRLPRPAQYLSLLLFSAVPMVVVLAALLVSHHTAAFARAGRVATAAVSSSSPLPAGQVAPFFTPEVRHWEKDILRWGQIYHLDPNLIATVMQIESCGDPQALSSAGARGLFQVMPFHFSAGENPFDPETNARRGLLYLQRALRQGGSDPALALAGYNGGVGVIGQRASSWPAETQTYVHWGAAIYRDAAAGKARSPALEGWLAARGRSLCLQAHRRLGLP